MAMKFNCPKCKRPLKAKREVLGGKTIQCPTCGQKMRLPAFVPEELRRFVYRSVN